jgi:transcriptional regulator with XRE-family HTH domain
MDASVDASSHALAERIRLERRARGWSLADLAQRSGVAKAAIHRIENGQASPTAVVLIKLAAAFELTLAGLFARAEYAFDRVTREKDQPVWRDPATGYVRRQLFARPDHPVEMARVMLPAAARVTLPAESYARIRQALWLIEGALVIEGASGRHELAAGDSIAFGAPEETTFANEGAAPAVYLIALSRS